MKECYSAWHAKTKKDMDYVDSDTWGDFVDKETKASEKRNTTGTETEPEEEP